MYQLQGMAKKKAGTKPNDRTLARILPRILPGNENFKQSREAVLRYHWEDHYCCKDRRTARSHQTRVPL